MTKPGGLADGKIDYTSILSRAIIKSRVQIVPIEITAVIAQIVKTVVAIVFLLLKRFVCRLIQKDNKSNGREH